MAKHVLVPQWSLWTVQSHPDTMIGFSDFKRLWPQKMKAISETSRKTCLCETCNNHCLKSEALKKFGCSSGDSELKSLSKTFSVSARILSHATLCPYDKHPKQECLNRCCNECSTKLLESCYSAMIEEVSPNDVITWYEWDLRLLWRTVFRSTS